MARRTIRAARQEHGRPVVKAARKKLRAFLGLLDRSRTDEELVEMAAHKLSLSAPPNRIDALVLLSRHVPKPAPAPEKVVVTGFYGTPRWRALRYRVLREEGRRCFCCGASGKDIEVHVDHIKPRSLFPELEWERSNLQVLCKDCNLGKSNTDEIDWREAS